MTTTTTRTGEAGGEAVDPQRAVRERRTMGPGFGPGSQRELMDADTFTGRPARGRMSQAYKKHGGAAGSFGGETPHPQRSAP